MCRWVFLAASIGLAGCGGSDSSLFNGSGNKGGSDAASASGGSSSGGASAGGSSGNAGASTGGNGVAGASSSGGRKNSPDGSAGASGAAPDGSAGTPTDASSGDTGAPGSGGASGTGGTPATGGRGGAATGGKGGTAGDAGPVGVATPMTVSCGTSTCTITSGITNVCCALPLAFPPFPTGCYPIFPGCVTTGVPFACDDAADCTNGNICCGSTTGTACAKTCPNGRVQFCRTNDECKSGQCRPWSTTKEYSTCQ